MTWQVVARPQAEIDIVEQQTGRTLSLQVWDLNSLKRCSLYLMP
jgi:hypothetical protein